MQIITITTFFPNPSEPARAVFLTHLVRALRTHCPVRVIAPIPWAPPIGRWKTSAAVPAVEFADGHPVMHPRFPIVPKLAWLSGFGYFLGTLRTLIRERRGLDACVVHAHCAYPDAVGVALAARLLGLPFAITAHGSDINVYAQVGWLRPQIRWALRSASAVIVVSRDLQHKVAALTGSGAASIHCIPCAAFDPKIFFPRPRGELRRTLDLAEAARVVVFAGRLVAIKGLEFLVDAWLRLASEGRLHDDDRLVLIGDGPEHDALLRRIGTRAPSARILFTGTLDQATVAQWIAAASILCLPSRNEGTPNVIVEALACGTPVVASRVGGIPDLIQEGVNGLLVPAADVDALATALTQAFAMPWDPGAIRHTVEERSWTTLGQRNWAVLRSIAREVYDVSMA